MTPVQFASNPQHIRASIAARQPVQQHRNTIPGLPFRRTIVVIDEAIAVVEKNFALLDGDRLRFRSIGPILEPICSR
jgi:hypothetical protein